MAYELYNKTYWVDDSEPAISAENLNKIEEQLLKNSENINEVDSSVRNTYTKKETNEILARDYYTKSDVNNQALKGNAYGNEINIDDAFHFGHPLNMKLFSKNRIKQEYSSETINGISFNVETDGRIRLSGTSTSTAETKYELATGRSFESGTYFISGCPSDGVKNKYYILVTSDDLEKPIYVTDTGRGASFELKETTTLSFYICVAPNVSTDAVFAPMLEKSNVKTEYTKYVSDFSEYLTYVDFYQDGVRQKGDCCTSDQWGRVNPLAAETSEFKIVVKLNDVIAENVVVNVNYLRDINNVIDEINSELSDYFGDSEGTDRYQKSVPDKIIRYRNSLYIKEGNIDYAKGKLALYSISPSLPCATKNVGAIYYENFLGYGEEEKTLIEQDNDGKKYFCYKLFTLIDESKNVIDTFYLIATDHYFNSDQASIGCIRDNRIVITWTSQQWVDGEINIISFLQGEGFSSNGIYMGDVTQIAKIFVFSGSTSRIITTELLDQKLKKNSTEIDTSKIYTKSEQDQQEIINLVLNAIPDGDEVEY